MINDLKKMKVENLNTAKDREARKRIIQKAKTFEFEVVEPGDDDDDDDDDILYMIVGGDG